jgi:hypothetical protein
MTRRRVLPRMDDMQMSLNAATVNALFQEFLAHLRTSGESPA